MKRNTKPSRRSRWLSVLFGKDQEGSCIVIPKRASEPLSEAYRKRASCCYDNGFYVMAKLIPHDKYCAVYRFWEKVLSSEFDRGDYRVDPFHGEYPYIVMFTFSSILLGLDWQEHSPDYFLGSPEQTVEQLNMMADFIEGLGMSNLAELLTLGRARTYAQARRMAFIDEPEKVKYISRKLLKNIQSQFLKQGVKYECVSY